MSVKIKINETGIKATIDQTWESGLEMLSSQILQDCNRYCKKDNGYLIMSSLIHSDLKHGRLVWNTPYAARQYYAIQTAYKEVNPDASWRWCEVAKQRHLPEWGRMAQEVTRLYKK